MRLSLIYAWKTLSATVEPMISLTTSVKISDQKFHMVSLNLRQAFKTFVSQPTESSEHYSPYSLTQLADRLASTPDITLAAHALFPTNVQPSPSLSRVKL
jgi:hypothetical protein